MTSRTAFAAPSRRALVAGVAERRRAWLEFMLAAKLQADRAARGFAAQPDELEALKRLLWRLPKPFPLRQACAVDVSGAVALCAQALIEAATPADREGLGAILIPALAFLERAVDDDSRARAELSRRITGDTDGG